jgi:hypothetical protein
MSARTDALVSRAETGKMSLASIVPRCVRLPPGGAQGQRRTDDLVRWLCGDRLTGLSELPSRCDLPRRNSAERHRVKALLT